MDYLRIDDDLLYTCVRAATEAGEIAESIKYTASQEKKEDNTIVTEGDTKAEKQIRDVLTDETDFPVLGEEFGGDIKDIDSYWVVDPIDGTQNYAYNQQMYGSAVALVTNGSPQVGCFYMPEWEDTYYAVSGKGAYRNGNELSVTNEIDLDDTYIVVSGHNISKIHDGITGAINRWSQRLSCALLAQGHLASGWNDVGVFGQIKPWDFGAGTLLVKEAGGVVKRMDTGETGWDNIMNGGVVMGNEELVDSVIDALPQNVIDTLTDEEYMYF